MLFRVLAAGMIVSAMLAGIVLARSGSVAIDAEPAGSLVTWLAEVLAILGFILFSLVVNRIFMALLSPMGSAMTGEAGWLALRTAGNACIAWIGMALLSASTWSCFSPSFNVTNL
ncbi:MAG: hypothetical protein K9J42_07910 [Sulfuritalea sp.]|nr:hypothetical protein [Sulfuritalea sp.]